MGKRLIFCVFVIFSCLIFSGNIWVWTDDDGVRHYSNVEPPQGVSFQEIEEHRRIEKKLNQSRNQGVLFQVIRVFDGDTVKVVGLDLKFTVRLAGIDSPERGFDGRPGQPYSKKAKQYLADLVENKNVSLKGYGSGGYNRQLAEIFLNGRNINLEMIASGMAEVYTGRLPKGLEADVYADTQKKARKNKKGIWKQGRAYKSPRQWRKENPRK